MRESLKNSPADETELVGYVNSSSLTRFAKSTIHQNVHEDNTNVFARVAVGKRIGVASTNRLTPEAIGKTVEKATAMAKESPEQHDFPGLPEAETRR